MGIYISGINLPKGKHSIVEITITEDGTVFTGSTDTFHKSDLRAYEVDSHHRRLIDADAFEARARAVYCDDCDRRKGVKNGKVRTVYGIGDVPCRACETGDMLCDIEDCPTVIEAEE